MNWLRLNLDINGLSKHNKRTLAKNADGIGIWMEVFYVISFISMVVNGLLILVTARTKFANLTGAGDPYEALIILVIIEHTILGIKFIIHKIIPEAPKWVRDKKKERRHRLERIREKQLKIEHTFLRRAMNDRKTNIDFRKTMKQSPKKRNTSEIEISIDKEHCEPITIPTFHMKTQAPGEIESVRGLKSDFDSIMMSDTGSNSHTQE